MIQETVEKFLSNKKNHILKGTKKKHVPGWQKMGIDPDDPNAWTMVIPVLDEVLKKGRFEGVTLEENGFITSYALDFIKEGVTVVVKVFHSFDGAISRISDAIPYVN